MLKIATINSFTVGQQFQLFSGAGATNASNFASVQSTSSGVVFSFTNGVLSVVTVSSGPTLTSVTPNPVAGSSYPVTLSLAGSGFVSVWHGEPDKPDGLDGHQRRCGDLQ